MKTLYHIAISTCLFIALLSTNAIGQTAKTAQQLVDEGTKLHDDKKYDEAIAKYKEAIKLEPSNYDANYEMAYTYHIQDKNKEAIPILERLIIISDRAKKGGAYDLLGSAYDDDKQTTKAIETYMAGLKNQPDYQRLYFNLGITHYRLKNYAEAEKWVIEAVKREPTHASSHKLYGEVCYYQGKKLNALLAFNYFLMLEPNKTRSGTVWKKIDTLFSAAGSKSIVVPASSVSKNGISPMFIAETSIGLATSAAAELEKRGIKDPAELLEFKLKTIFNAAGKAAADLTPPKGIIAGYADYFYKLAQSDNMPAFARYITLYTENESSVQWFADNEAKLKAFSAWADATKIRF